MEFRNRLATMKSVVLGLVILVPIVCSLPVPNRGKSVQIVYIYAKNQLFIYIRNFNMNVKLIKYLKSQNDSYILIVLSVPKSCFKIKLAKN